MVGGTCTKVAVTDLLASIVIVAGLAAPVRSPLHPANCHPAAGTAVRVTGVPAMNVLPAGFVWITPDPIVAVDSVNTGAAASATADVTIRLRPFWSHESVVGPLGGAASVDPAIPNRVREALNRFVWPVPGVKGRSLSEATISISQELGGALTV